VATPLKSETIAFLFSQYNDLSIIVNTIGMKSGLPENILGEPAICLTLKGNMKHATTIGINYIESTIYNRGVKNKCTIPMERIWCAHPADGRLIDGVIWKEDMPTLVKEIALAVEGGLEEGMASAIAWRRGNGHSPHNKDWRWIADKFRRDLEH